MANSQYEYVKNFELPDGQLPECWLVVRIDGRDFTSFTKKHNFEKPNDRRALQLMNKCAQVVMNEFADIVLAYGQSDEYSFVLRKHTTLFNRRASKITTNIVSKFASSYVFYWDSIINADESPTSPTSTSDCGQVSPTQVPTTNQQQQRRRPLLYPPAFDARMVCYPNDKILRDYLNWRQVDCHINNLYNTCFWTLVQQANMTTLEAEKALSGTFSADKNELLFSRFGINYNNIEPMFRKGSVLIRQEVEEPRQRGDSTVLKKKKRVAQLHCDIIGDQFWRENPDLLGGTQ